MKYFRLQKCSCALAASIAIFSQPVLAIDPPCTTPPSGLVSWWAAQGNAFDSGDNNQAVLAGNATYGPGKVGQAFVFDGDSDAVVVGAATNLQLQNFSIEAWIKRADPSLATFGTHTTALFFSYGSLGYGFGIWDDGRLFLTRVDIDNVSSEVSITDTNFHHVAVTRSGTTVVFYIDGVAHPAPAYATPFTFSTVAAIGARADTMDDSFLGTIDELAVYSRVLSPAEILSIYNADVSGKCRNPIAPFIFSQPTDQTVYIGDNTAITLGVNGDLPLSYQWRFNGGDLPGQTNSSLPLPNVQTNIAGVYSVFVTNVGGSILSSNATITVNARPPCTPVPDGIVSWWRGEANAFDAADNNHGTLSGIVSYGPGRVGQAFVFDGNGDAVQVGNPANLQLQDFSIEAWIKRANPSVATFGSHTTALFFGYGSGGYGFGMYDDGRLFLTRVDIDNVTLGTGISDTNFFHHVAVTKSNSTVVFYIDGVAYPVPSYSSIYTFSTVAAIGARADTLNDSFLGTIDELAVYKRALSPAEILAIYDADGSGKCKVPIPPGIITQPTNKTAYVGDTVTFNVVASGDPPLAYQWLFGGTNLAGRTANSLTLSNVQFSSAGNYSVQVSNAINSVLSSNAVLTVIPKPPCAPAPAGLVSWWRAENDSTDGWDSNNGQSFGVTFLDGKVGRAFNFASGAILVPDSLSLRFTNALTIEAWVKPSSLAGLTPRTILSKFEYPLSQTLVNQSSYYLGTTNNGSVLFMLSASGSARTNTALVTSQLLPTNQWSFVVAIYDGSVMNIFINGNLAAQTNYSGNIFPGSNNLGLGAIPFNIPLIINPGTGIAWPFSGSLDEVSLYNRALDSVEIQAIYNADVSGKCLVPPTITQQPQTQAVPLGEDALFSVSVRGSRPLKYQWRFNGVNLFGATNSTLLLERIQTNRAGNYSVAVTNALGFAFSSNATLSILPAPTCVPSPPGAISWWPADGSGNDAAGTNNATIQSSFITLPPSFSSSYATGKVGLAFSLNNAQTIDRPLPTVYVSNSPSLNFGSNADFSIEAWIKVVPSPSLRTLPNLTPYITILDKRSTSILTGVGGYSLLLNQGRLACWLASAPSSTTNSTMFVSSGPDLRDGMFHHVAVTLIRSVTNGGNLFVDGQAVLTFDPTARQGSLSNTANLLIGSPAGTGLFNAASNSFFYGLIDELALYNRALSAAEVLAIRQAGAAGKCKAFPIILTQPVSQKVTLGSNATFSVTVGGATPFRYQWFHNNVAQFGASNSTYSFLVQPSSVGSYFVRITNVFGTAMSSSVLLTMNNPPVALPQQVSLNEDTPAPITLHGADPQLDPLSYSIVTAPAHGSLIGLPPNLTYIPATNYFGPDAFTFKVNDGLADSAPATISLTVLPVNDAPVAIPQSLSVNEDTPLNIILTGSDVENDPLTFAILIPPSHGVLSGAPPALTYLAFTNYNGRDSFTFKANDGQTDSLPATVSITIIPVNDAPVAVATVSPLFTLSSDQTNLLILSINNSNAVVVLDGSASTDVENDPLTFSWIEGTNTIGMGVKVTNTFLVGPHDVTLQVSDGMDNGSTTSSFEVITPGESVGQLILLLETSALASNVKRPLEATLQAAAASFEAGRFTPALNQMQAFENKVQAQIGRTDPALADELIRAAEEILDRLRSP